MLVRRRRCREVCCGGRYSWICVGRGRTKCCTIIILACHVMSYVHIYTHTSLSTVFSDLACHVILYVHIYMYVHTQPIHKSEHGIFGHDQGEVA
jgi:hypothetical protein